MSLLGELHALRRAAVAKESTPAGVRTAVTFTSEWHGRFGNTLALGDLAPQFLREPGHQTIQFFGVGARQRIAWGRRAGDAMAPRRCRISFRMARPTFGCCLVPHERQIEIEEIFGAFRIAGKKPFEHFNQHLGIRESRHGAVSAALQFERIIERAVPDENTHAANTLLL